MIAYAKPDDADTGEVPYVFRTYNNTSLDARNPGMAHDCQIWQVVLATAAAPGLFPTAKFDGKEYLDGGFGANNPSHEASLELSNLHPSNPICLVSIGSGKRRAAARFQSHSLGQLFSYVRAAVSLATGTENVHQNMREVAALSESFSYFRFDVPGLEDVNLDEWTVKRREQLPNSEKMHTIDFIEKQTNGYLAQDKTRVSIRNCAQMVVDSYCHKRGSTPPMKYEAAQSLKQEALQRFLQVPARNNLFHGRKETLQLINEHLGLQALDKASRLQTCILYGLGGIGKTEIAIEYVYRYKHIYEYVFWVRASNEVQLAKSYSSISPTNVRDAVGNPDVKQDIMEARNWLSSTGEAYQMSS